MPQDMKLPDGTYGVPDPDQPHVMTLWWVHKGRMHTWPKGHRWAPFPPTPSPHLSKEARREHRDGWYASVYWPWKHAVIDAIAADLDGARARFAEHLPEHERPVIPAAGKKPKSDKRRAEEIQAAFLHDQRNMSLDEVADRVKLPRTTAWRRIQDGRELLEQMMQTIERVSPESPFVLAAKRFESTGNGS